MIYFNKCFHEIPFSCIFRKKCKKKNFIKMTAIFIPVCFKYPISFIIRFTELKMHSYARNMNSNRKFIIKYVETENFDLFSKQNGDFF